MLVNDESDDDYLDVGMLSRNDSALAEKSGSDVCMASLVEAFDSSVALRRKIVALGDKEPYNSFPELKTHAVKIADLLMGVEVPVRRKTGDNTSADKVCLSKGIMHYTYTTPTIFQKNLLAPLKAAYGTSAWDNDIPICSRAGTDFVRPHTGCGTRRRGGGVHEDWQLDAKSFPRLMSLLQKGFMVTEWMRKIEEELVALPQLQSVEDVEEELATVKTHLVHANAIREFARGSPCGPASNSTSAWLQARVDALDNKKKEVEKANVYKMKLLMDKNALQMGGLTAVHWSALPSYYVKKNQDHVAKYPSAVCMPDECWPVNFGRDVTFFVKEIKKLVSRVTECNVYQVALADTGGDKDLVAAHATALTALKRKLVEDPTVYDKLKDILDLPAKKKHCATHAPEEEPLSPEA